MDINDLYFQYIPEKFFKDVYPGDEKTMMNIVNSPHYRFLQLYRDIGYDIIKHHRDTDYTRLQEFWGRKEKRNIRKVKKFIKTYNSIKNEGIKSHIVVASRPIHKKFFDRGYEIYHGHHRAAACHILGYNKVKCKIVKVK